MNMGVTNLLRTQCSRFPEKVFSVSGRNVSVDLPECAEEDAAGRLTTLKVRHDGVQWQCT